MDTSTWMEPQMHFAKWKKPNIKATYYDPIYMTFWNVINFNSAFTYWKTANSVWLPTEQIQIASAGTQCPP